ncbi:hypothetical protein COU17_00705 [Candidatus Kaiserbacteria bacterium CG10_big_fil_rev_8_21_14_0_10_49_17]|uniref:Uncharacterized protein n=1 Tax=Candidatus Kaiserbacteria bacterium CG10_big_fil_rev_8_21_14_0_10_49_17 TaxID=1974609 RepID=A0A2M6WFD0_9BACT|nr:MAG: hypothetical protein COU17_00705 [Candidatus Kaiserbacteria bacterium CG10_big_fil_rev_8_21_14_0_10_49_17]
MCAKWKRESKGGGRAIGPIAEPGEEALSVLWTFVHKELSDLTPIPCLNVQRNRKPEARSPARRQEAESKQ